MSELRSYSTGVNTKRRIIEVCKDLFCKKGYRGASYVEICKAAKVNPGTINYHYKSKRNIASILYNQMMDLFFRRTSELFPDEDDLQQVMIAAGLHQKLLFDDPVYRRFSSQFSSDCIHIDSPGDYRTRVTKAYEVTLERVGQKKADFLFTAYKGMDAYIEPYVEEHINELTFEEFFKYVAVLYYQFIDSDELKGRMSNALKNLNALIITFKRFDITIRPVD